MPKQAKRVFEQTTIYDCQRPFFRFLPRWLPISKSFKLTIFTEVSSGLDFGRFETKKVSSLELSELTFSRQHCNIGQHPSESEASWTVRFGLNPVKMLDEFSSNSTAFIRHRLEFGLNASADVVLGRSALARCTQRQVNKTVSYISAFLT